MFLSGKKRIDRIFIADPGLCDDNGHHYGTSTELARTATSRGLQARILSAVSYTGQAAVTDVFTRSLYEPRIKVRLPMEAATRSGPLVDKNSVDMMLHGERANVSAADAYLFHTVTIEFFASLMDYFVLTPPDRLASHHFLFRYDPVADAWAGSAATLAETVRKLKALNLMGWRVFLYAETDALAHAYSQFCDAPVNVMYHFSVLPPAAVQRSLDGPVKIGFLGEARVEKGFDAYHHAVNAVMERLGDRVQFVTQSYTAAMNAAPEITAADAFFRGARYGARHRVLSILDDADYGRELAACDVLILAHRTPRYTRRGSGIFVDGIVHGKVMVLRNGTWMSSVCPDELAVPFGQDYELAAAIERAVERAEAQRSKPLTPSYSRVLFDAGTNIQEVMRHHLSAMLAPAPTRPLRVLHIAPLWIRQGSTRVFESQLKVLAELGATVMCVHLANYPIGEDLPESTYNWFLDAAPAGGAVHQWLVATIPDADAHGKAVADSLQGKSLSWLHEWTQAQTFEIPASLAAFAKSGGIDLVVLNYAHNLPLVLRLGLGDTPIIVETHDIRSHQFASLGSPADAERDELAEITALKTATGIVYINQNEATRVGSQMADTPAITVLPTLPLNLDPAWVATLHHGSAAQRGAVMRSLADKVAPPDKDRSGLTEFFTALRLTQGRVGDLICFLGSVHHWNMVSLEWLYAEVFVPYLLRRGITLVIAGKAGEQFHATHGRQPGVIVIGETRDIAALYESGITFVVPVQGGTGFPIKTLEAMMAGNPVVGTSQAFRGFPDLAAISSVEDDPLGFARAVLQIAQTPPRATSAKKPKVLTWANYRSEWVKLITKVTGQRPAKAPVPPPEQWIHEDDTELAPDMVPLVVDPQWTCSAATQPAFLAASIGFSPSSAETDFCWSAESDVAIALTLSGPARAIEFSVIGVVPPADGTIGQDVVIFVGGVHVGRVRVMPQSSIVVPLGPEYAGSGPHGIEIEFALPTARHGMESGGWKEKRRLAMAIASIRAVR